MAAVVLGAGRARKEDVIDPAVGIVLARKVGDPVQAGEVLATLHYNDEALSEGAASRLAQAYRIGPTPPIRRPLVWERITTARSEP
jgi:thymidine phosphorylase